MSTIAELKKRAAQREAQAEPPKPAPPDPKEQQVRRHLTPERRREVEDLGRAIQDENADRVDLGELPEEVKASQERAEAEEKEKEEVRKRSDVTYSFTTIDNPEVRALIEERCEDMDFGDLLQTGRVTQEVIIIPEKLSVTFQSLKTSEIWWTERHATETFVHNYNANTWVGYAKMVMGLVAINDSPLPPIRSRKKSSDPDSKQFEDKFNLVFNHGEHVIELIMMNYLWFNDRVRELYRNDFDLLKNG